MGKKYRYTLIIGLFTFLFLLFSFSNVKAENVSPNISTSSYKGIGDEIVIEVKASSNTNLASADFQLSYDDEKLECLSTSVADEINEMGALITVDEDCSSGLINFSFSCGIGLRESITLLSVKLKTIENYQYTTNINLTATNAVYSLSNDVTLECRGSEIEILESFSVKFYNYDNNLLKEKYVGKGLDVSIDIIPSRENCTFLGWDKELANIQSDLSVYPIYSLNEGIFVFEDETHTYTGNTYSLSINNTYSYISIDYENNDKINAGTYEVLANIFLDEEYQYTLTANLIIDKAETIIEVYENEFTYDGTTQSIMADINHIEGSITYENNDKINAGTYEVVIKAKESRNYKEATKVVDLIINKAETEIIVYENDFLYDG